MNVFKFSDWSNQNVVTSSCCWMWAMAHIYNRLEIWKLCDFQSRSLEIKFMPWKFRFFATFQGVIWNSNVKFSHLINSFIMLHKFGICHVITFWICLFEFFFLKEFLKSCPSLKEGQWIFILVVELNII